MYCDYCGLQMTSAPSHQEHAEECSKNPKNEVVALREKVAALQQAALESALEGRSHDWDVKVWRRRCEEGLRYRTVFRSGSQYFLLAWACGDEGREHALFMKKMFLKALERLGVRRGS